MSGPIDIGSGSSISGAVTATLAAETTKVIGTVNDKVADGDNVTQGAKADAAIVDPASSASGIALLKGQLTELLAILASIGSKTDAKVRLQTQRRYRLYRYGKKYHICFKP